MASHQDTALKLEKVGEELTCSICNAFMEDPHALFCGHAYCGRCILEWLKTKKTCPMCRVSVVRQPIHVSPLQKLVDILRPENNIPEKRLERSDWLTLFPIDNHVTYIRDEDEDGVILRCSQCGWELDEENYCASCGVHYDVDDHTNNNSTIEVSDTESHRQDDENLSDFVVDDNHVVYSTDNTDDEMLRNVDANTYSSLSGIDPSTAIEIDDDDDSDAAVTYRRKRRPRISSEDEESDMHSDEDSNADNSMTYGTDDDEGEEEPVIQEISDDDDVEEEEEEDDDDDVDEDQEENNRYFSRFVDEYADEDESEEEDTPKPPKVDKIMETITRAKKNMKKDAQETKSSSDNTSDDDDDSDAADYDMTINSTKTADKVIPKPLEKPKPSSSKPVVVVQQETSKKNKKRKQRNKNKKNKKKAKLN